MQDGWLLTLDDGSEVAGPRPGAFKGIPTERMRSLVVYDEGRAIRVDLAGERRPLIVRRVRRRMNMTTGEAAEPEVVLGVGYYVERDGLRSQALCWIAPDGSLTLSPRHIREIDTVCGTA